jgi:hypothetical protein
MSNRKEITTKEVFALCVITLLFSAIGASLLTGDFRKPVDLRLPAPPTPRILAMLVEGLNEIRLFFLGAFLPGGVLPASILAIVMALLRWNLESPVPVRHKKKRKKERKKFVKSFKMSSLAVSNL